MIKKFEFPPTDEQQAIAQASKDGQTESVMVQAYAGCAKTSTIQLAGQGIKVPALALAFNKKIAKELVPRFGGNFSVKTLNGLGLGALARGLPGVTIDFDDARGNKKLGKLVSQVAKDRKVSLSLDQWSDLRSLVSKAMQAGISPADVGEPLTPDTRESWQAIAQDELWLPDDQFDFLFEMAHQVLEENNALTRKGIISFDDQVYYPTVLSGKWAKFPVVVVDEAQDLSPLNHKMLELSLRDDGKLIAVGDRKQAIYQFRGASADSMDRVARLRQTWKTLPLTMTFRCPKVIVARQQQHAPGFRAAPGNAQGTFTSFQARTSQQIDDLELGGWSYKDLEGLKPGPGAQVAILCRNNGPLLAMAFKLLRAGIGVHMLGRDIGKSLIKLSSEIIKDDQAKAEICAGLIEDWKSREGSLARANEKEERLASIYDRADCLQAVLSNAQVRNAGDLRSMLRKLFEKESGQVVLGSIHRSKGLEWDLVVHLDPWRLPAKAAKQAAQAGDTRQLEQEYNLKYVCETRAKHTLVEANLEDFHA